MHGLQDLDHVLKSQEHHFVCFQVPQEGFEGAARAASTAQQDVANERLGYIVELAKILATEAKVSEERP